MCLVIGALAVVVVVGVDYHRVLRWSRPALGLSLVLLALVLVPGVGVSVNGATRWLGYGPFSLQPSELAKLTVLLFVADLLARRAAWMGDVRLTLRPAATVFRSEEHTSELQSLMRISYAVFCLKKKNT